VPFASGGVIASPVTFPLADGGTGLAGERGAEAILPLARGPDGKLGVAAQGGGGVAVTFNVTTPDADSFRRSESQVAAMLARAVALGQRNL
jgi:phage-related minor tail protein